jgi:hypothetical protein
MSLAVAFLPTSCVFSCRLHFYSPLGYKRAAGVKSVWPLQRSSLIAGVGRLSCADRRARNLAYAFHSQAEETQMRINSTFRLKICAMFTYLLKMRLTQIALIKTCSATLNNSLVRFYWHVPRVPKYSARTHALLMPYKLCGYDQVTLTVTLGRSFTSI